MITPKVTQIHHPSGRLYEAFSGFVRSHPLGSFFQSDLCYRFAREWPEAEPVLLVALREEGLKDPGRDRKSMSGWLGRGEGLLFDHEMDHVHKAGSGEGVSAGRPMIAGSLLGFIVREPLPEKGLFRGLMRMLNPLTARAMVYGGPLLAEGTRLEKEMVLKVLVKALQDKVENRSLFTQFRNFYDLTDYVPVFRNLGFGWHDRLNLLVDTSTREVAWNGMSASRRRQVRKSMDAGAVLVHEPSTEQIDAFYDILRRLYLKKIRKPLPSLACFHLLTQGYGKIILLSHQDRIIGGIACPLLEGQTMHEWYVCGLDRDYVRRDIYPSVMLTWAAMELAAEKKVKIFDFMGLGKPDQSYGVRDFKKRFGDQLVNHGRFSKVNRPLLFHIAQMGYNLKTKSPR